MSSSEDIHGRQQNGGSSDDEEDQINKTKKLTKKKPRVIDSDSEAELEDDKESSKVSFRSDSEPEETTLKEKKSLNRISRSGLLDSSDIDSENDTEDNRQRKQLSDDEEEERLENGSRSDNEDLSSASDKGPPSSDEDRQMLPKQGVDKSKPRKNRKSKQDALKEIYSESQRLLRESKVGLPYHRPRQRTLDEFLNRKKGAPELIADLKSLPKVGTNIEDVQKVEKIFEEREKLAETFYQEEDDDGGDTQDDGEDALAIETEKAAEDQETTQVDEIELEGSEVVNLDRTDVVERGSENSKQVEGFVDEKAHQECASREEMDESSCTQDVAAKGDASKREEESQTNRLEEEEESLRLFLEPDSEKLVAEDDDILPSSQKAECDSTVSEKENSVLAKRLKALGAKFDTDALNATLSKKPMINREDIELVLEDEYHEDGGLETLKDRFVKHVRAGKKRSPPKKVVEMISVVRKEIDPKGNVSLKEEKISYSATEPVGRNLIDFEAVRRAQQSEKPGAQHEALKTTLRQKIFEEKLKELTEREKLKKLDNEDGQEGEDDDNDEPDVEDILDDEDEEDLGEEEEEEETEEDEEEEDDVASERRTHRIKSAFIDDEAEDEDGNGSEPDEEDHIDDHCVSREQTLSESLQNTPAASNSISLTQGGTTPFSLFTSEVRWTPATEDGGSESTARKKLGFEGLFDQTDPNPEGFDEVIGLCSGQFVTQKATCDADDVTEADTESLTQLSQTSQTPDTVVMTKELTQNLISKASTEKDTQDTLLLTESTEPERAPGFMEEYPGFLDSSDSEDEKPKSEPSKRGRKGRRRVVISDDEDEEDEREHGDAASEAEDGAEESEVEEREVMYDSEENEIEVEPQKFKGFVGKKGRIRGEYLEREAELSGSDVGSEDENEEGMDRLLLEDGDLDDVDEELVRDEVGRIHHRQILDEDQREVRLLQEAFLEDGELHSDNGRTRKFRWKDSDVDVDNENRLTQSGDEEDEANDREDEKWRVDRLQREKWIQEAETKQEVDNLKSDKEDSQFFSVATKVLKKLDSKTKSLDSTLRVDKATKDFKSPKTKLPLQNLSGNKRGSFLSRDNSTLQKLAEMTRGTGSAKAGAGAKNSRNFIFAVLSPTKQNLKEKDEDKEAEKEKHKKRKVLNDKSTNKRPKMDRSIDENSRDTIFGAL